MMSSGYKLNKQGDSIQPWHTPLAVWKSESEVAQSCLTLCNPVDCSAPGSSIHGILQARILEWVAISFSRGSSWPRDQTQPVCFSMSGSNCCFLICIQISQEAGQVVSYSHFFQNFPQFVVVHTVKGFGIGNEAEGDAFLEFPCFFNEPTDVGNLISGSSAFSKSSLYIWNFSVHILLKPSLENFEHYFASVWDECKCAVVWTFFGIAFLRDWKENCPFPVLWPLLSFPNLLTYWVHHFNSIIF